MMRWHRTPSCKRRSATAVPQWETEIRQSGIVGAPPDWPAVVMKWLRRAAANDQTNGKYGAGEGIRTLDPDLGKVVLYP